MATIALRLTAAIIAAACVTLPSTAAAAAESPGRTAAAQQITCDVIQQIAGPLLGLGLPLETVVNRVFNLLNRAVPVEQIRECLTG